MNKVGDVVVTPLCLFPPSAAACPPPAPARYRLTQPNLSLANLVFPPRISDALLFSQLNTKRPFTQLPRRSNRRQRDEIVFNCCHRGRTRRFPPPLLECLSRLTFEPSWSKLQCSCFLLEPGRLHIQRSRESVA